MHYMSKDICILAINFFLRLRNVEFKIILKRLKKHIGPFLLVIFLLPMAIDSVHDFLNHEHTICSSKIEKHLHEKDLDCKLHLMKKGDSFLTTAHYKIITNIIIYNNSLQYSFLKNHYQLSFYLRGPPLYVQA